MRGPQAGARRAPSSLTTAPVPLCFPRPMGWPVTKYSRKRDCSSHDFDEPGATIWTKLPLMRQPTKQTRAAPAPAARKALKASPATETTRRNTDQPAAKSAPKPTQRFEELRFKVTETFRQQFKQAAKDLGLKKSAFLEKLLADWHARQPASAERSVSVLGKGVSPAKPRRAKKSR